MGTWSLVHVVPALHLYCVKPGCWFYLLHKTTGGWAAFRKHRVSGEVPASGLFSPAFGLCTSQPRCTHQRALGTRSCLFSPSHLCSGTRAPGRSSSVRSEGRRDFRRRAELMQCRDVPAAAYTPSSLGFRLKPLPCLDSPVPRGHRGLQASRVHLGSPPW